MAGDREQLPDGTWLWLNAFARWIGTWVFYVIFRLRIRKPERIPRTGAVVVVANHSALIDGPLLFGLVGRRCTFLIKQEMFRGPLAWVLPRIGQLSVHRGEPDRTPLLAAVRVLRAGGMVAVFPEGTRGSGDVAAAQNGAAWLARTTGATVLPVACRGTRRPDGAGRRFRPKVDVLVGDPMPAPHGKGKAGLVAGSEQLRAELARLVVELDTMISGGQHPEPPGKDVG